MADHRVARRYASALFASAAHHNVVKAVEEDYDSIAAIFNTQPKFANVLLSPEVSREEKIALCEKIFADRTTALTMQSLRLILKKGRQAELLAIRDEFTILRRENENVLFAKVTSCEVLDDKQKTEVIARLRLTTGKQVEATFEIDPSIIGGIRATFGNTVLDGSLRGSLAELRDRLFHDLLKQA